MVCWSAPKFKTRVKAIFFARENLKLLSSFPVWDEGALKMKLFDVLIKAPHDNSAYLHTPSYLCLQTKKKFRFIKLVVPVSRNRHGLLYVSVTKSVIDLKILTIEILACKLSWMIRTAFSWYGNGRRNMKEFNFAKRSSLSKMIVINIFATLLIWASVKYGFYNKQGAYLNIGLWISNWYELRNTLLLKLFYLVQNELVHVVFRQA